LFSAISSIKLWQFWRDLVRSFLNKFAGKLCKRIPPHLNNVSTLPCEIWSAHRAHATTALSEIVTLKLIPPQLWPSNSPDLNPVDYSVQEYWQRRCTKHASLIWMCRRRHWWTAVTMKTWSSWATQLSVAVSLRKDQWYIFWTPSFTINISHTLQSTEFKSGEFGGHC